MPADELHDGELISRIAAGDADAFAVLFRRRQGQVYRFALHMTASASIAEDVTQDVFIALMSDAGRYDPARASVAAWLCGIARNHVRRRADRDRRLQPLIDDDAGEPSERADGLLTVAGDALGDLTRAEGIDALRHAVLTLPLRYREAVVLCDLQEMTYADAAAALAVPVGTVRSRVHRGRGLLAVKLTASAHAGAGDAARSRKAPSTGPKIAAPSRTFRNVRNLA